MGVNKSASLEREKDFWSRFCILHRVHRFRMIGSIVVYSNVCAIPLRRMCWWQREEWMSIIGGNANNTGTSASKTFPGHSLVTLVIRSFSQIVHPFFRMHSRCWKNLCFPLSWRFITFYYDKSNIITKTNRNQYNVQMICVRFCFIAFKVLRLI